MWLPGVYFMIFGLWLAIAPVDAARFASRLRFTGLSRHPSDERVRAWRVAGALMAFVGLVLITTSL